MEEDTKGAGMKHLNAKYFPIVGNRGNEMHHLLLDALSAVTSRGTRISEIWSCHGRPISAPLRQTEKAKAKALRPRVS